MLSAVLATALVAHQPVVSIDNDDIYACERRVKGYNPPSAYDELDTPFIISFFLALARDAEAVIYIHSDGKTQEALPAGFGIDWVRFSRERGSIEQQYFFYLDDLTFEATETLIPGRELPEPPKAVDGVPPPPPAPPPYGQCKRLDEIERAL